MKWSKKQEDKLRKLCFEGKSNAELAEVFECGIRDIHAARSRLGITIPKVQAELAQRAKEMADKKAEAKKAAKAAGKVEVKKAVPAAAAKQEDQGKAAGYELNPPRVVDQAFDNLHTALIYAGGQSPSVSDKTNMLLSNIYSDVAALVLSAQALLHAAVSERL